MDEISQIFQCSFTLFVSKSHEHRFNAVLTAFSKKQGMPTYTSQKFQTKTRFYLYFLTCAWACSSARKKIAFRNLKKFSNAHLHISFFQNKTNEIFVINKLRKYGIFQMQELEKNT